MERLWIAVATCVLTSCSVKGNDWWWKYEEGIRQYSTEALNEVPAFITGHNYVVVGHWMRSFSWQNTALSSDGLMSNYEQKAFLIDTFIEKEAEKKAIWVHNNGIGGYGSFQDAITLANIIKLFNPNLVGAAPGKTVHGMQAHISETGFNLAVTGHNTFNLPGQTRHLIDTLRDYEGLNFEEDWKLLTILMGMNDICDYCKDKKRLEKLLYSDHFFKDDFAVVLQPFLKDADPPRLSVIYPLSADHNNIDVAGDESARNITQCRLNHEDPEGDSCSFWLQKKEKSRFKQQHAKSAGAVAARCLVERPERTETGRGYRRSAGDLALQKYRKAAKFCSECVRESTDRLQSNLLTQALLFFSIPGELYAPRLQNTKMIGRGLFVLTILSNCALSLPLTPSQLENEDVKVMKCIVEALADVLSRPHPTPVSQECLVTLKTDDRLVSILRHHNFLKELQAIAVQGGQDRAQLQREAVTLDPMTQTPRTAGDIADRSMLEALGGPGERSILSEKRGTGKGDGEREEKDESTGDEESQEEKDAAGEVKTKNEERPGSHVSESVDEKKEEEEDEEEEYEDKRGRSEDISEENMTKDKKGK
ncbi:Chromogranin-A [Nibea albiflora]|uniref:Chromogranin-A n=1 Tax=Nibea albiflora TaxID=240163 RepID=A0ACB7FBD0_NIBAL|nr:Chromogranin-A [Nibea albiflora]